MAEAISPSKEAQSTTTPTVEGEDGAGGITSKSGGMSTHHQQNSVNVTDHENS